MAGNDFSGNDGDFYLAWQSLTFGGGSRVDKQLPAAKSSPAIPARIGTSGRIVTPTASSGGATNMTLAGPRTYQSTDGLLTLSFPNSAEVVVESSTLILPALVSTP